MKKGGDILPKQCVHVLVGEKTTGAIARESMQRDSPGGLMLHALRVHVSFLAQHYFAKKLVGSLPKNENTFWYHTMHTHVHARGSHRSRGRQVSLANNTLHNNTASNHAPLTAVMLLTFEEYVGK